MKNITRKQEEQEIYYTLISTSSTKEKLNKNLAMAWIDYKKVYIMVPQSQTIYCLKMYKISNEVHQRNHEKLESWTDSRRKKFHWSKNPERYIPGKCAISITICNSNDATHHILRKCTGRDKLHKSQEKINNLMNMDNIKLFIKNEKELKTLI